jgi:hypothetical protein
MKQYHLFIALLLAIMAVSYAGEALTEEKNITGYASFEEGQIVNGTYLKPGLRSDHVLVQRMYAGLNFETKFNPLPITTNLGIEMRMSNEFPRKGNDFGRTRRLYFYPYLTQANFSYSFGNSSKPFLSITAGYFPIKYNADTRNLGEYLFRSGTYPQYLVTDFDFPATRLAGIKFGGSLLDGLQWDLIANSNVEWQAIGDLNLSGLVSYNFHDIFEVGGGFTFTSLLSADPNITGGSKLQSDEATKYKKTNGDTAILTFAGTKVMGMVSFDPKKFIPGDFFMKQDLKIYSEAAVLGVKDYPLTLDSATRYDSLLQRIPVTVGINWPTHQFASYCILPGLLGYLVEPERDAKIFKAATFGAGGLLFGVGAWFIQKYTGIDTRLDVISCEGEWFGSRLPNDMGGVVLYNIPTPLPGDKVAAYKADPGHLRYKEDDKKWSIYAKKTFVGHFTVTGQLASDHLRWFAQDWAVQEWEEAFRKYNQYYYILKAGYVF